MSTYNIVATSNESTVVAEFVPEEKKAGSYQSETELEADFIKRLLSQEYERLYIHTEKDLIDNLRNQLEKINDYQFSDEEWDSFYGNYIANANEGIVEKTRTIQEDSVKVLTKDDGTSKNITLLDKNNIHNNRLQVLNQYEVSKVEGAKHDNRYDVTILVNGLPLVHIELKRRGVAIREAFNQINRYQRDSFWSGCGLYEYVQIFIISNGTQTKYFSNTTRDAHIKEVNGKGNRKSKKTSNSFEFTSFWADTKNNVISDLVDFTKTFLSKHTILNILTKYCVFTSEKLLLVMRPYQIAATEKIINRIEIASNYKKYGTKEGGGYVWHTTGSGKTLTSFKTAQLASKMDCVDKVLFVVDRKDLDYQTMKEYDRFEKGAANSNSSSAVLKKQLEDDNAKIIITTIQKLSNFVDKNKEHEVYGKHVVIIFDECHRSQFGAMHKAITEKFKKYHILGFTGTPIFADNANTSSKNPDIKTTEQLFGDKLHSYTIVDAINDDNVLPFRIDYIETFKEDENVKDEKVKAIDREKALQDPRRISEIVRYILEHFSQKTKRNRDSFSVSVLTNIADLASEKNRNLVKEEKRLVHMKGFNSIFAVGSVDFAKLYYSEFKKQQNLLPESQRLKVATIYSYGVNEEVTDDFVEDENNEDTDGLDASSRDFLDQAIIDYNQMFHTNYSTDSERFQNYYKDVSLRMKNREIDLLIVVNMFLTGFDATTLNTLWVDKNLKYHGLIQAFSRTNRILNSVKTFGNIVCFRNLEKATNEAIALFGNKEAKGIVLLKNFNSYYFGYDDENNKHHMGYVELVTKLFKDFPLGTQIIGEQLKKEFIKLFGQILRARNILSTFDEFEGKAIFTDREFQDYQSLYLDLYNVFKQKEDDDKEIINGDIVFEIELIKQVDINVDYILQLVKQYQKNNDKEILISIDKATYSSLELRSKQKLIQDFISRINPNSDVDLEWKIFADKQRKEDLDVIISEEKLKRDETYHYMLNSFRDGVMKVTGKEIDSILPPISRFSAVGNRDDKKKKVTDRLTSYFNMYLDLFLGDSTLVK